MYKPLYYKQIAFAFVLGLLLSSCGASVVKKGSDTDALPSLPPVITPPTTLTDETVPRMREVSYRYMSGKAGIVTVDVATITINELKAKVVQQENLGRQSFKLLYENLILSECDTRFLTDVVTLAADEEFTLVINNNLEIAKELLGNNYLGIEAWQQLGLKEEEIHPFDLPMLSKDILAAIERLQGLDQQPILFLDLGYSITAMEKLCKDQSIEIFSINAGNLREKLRYHIHKTGSPRWILVPGSDNGALPGSRTKFYNEQITYMETNYPGYEVGGIRELVTLTILQYVQNREILFARNPCTFVRCQNFSQKSWWKVPHICLGYNHKNSSGKVSGLSFVNTVGASSSVALFSYLRCPA